ncbi:MAG TPA: hypothetical protein VK097_07895 [Lentibacillus sp.]|nr:hypothetical protein [Lentibacillus sp.]HLR62349.1 hypothetical protein [Lentibacillus sp.]
MKEDAKKMGRGYSWLMANIGRRSRESAEEKLNQRKSDIINR